MIGRWHGRESVHAGAFAVDGRACGVVGTPEAGKSSALAWLALAGADVLCVDLLVVDGRTPFAGPRSIELRADAAERLGARERLERLVPQHGTRLPPARADALLEPASLPAWEVSRPREWASLPEAGRRLLELATATPTGAS